MPRYSLVWRFLGALGVLVAHFFVLSDGHDEVRVIPSVPSKGLHLGTNESPNNVHDTDFWTESTVNYVRPLNAEDSHQVDHQDDSSKSSIIHIRRGSSGADDDPLDPYLVTTPVSILNGRAIHEEFSLRRNGFELCSLSSVPGTITQNQESDEDELPDIDFHNSSQVIDKYYPLCEELVATKLQDDTDDDNSTPRRPKVRAFDHNIRDARVYAESFGAATALTPATVVHGDYTFVSSLRRLEDLSKAMNKTNDVLQSQTSLVDPNTVAKIARSLSSSTWCHPRFAFVNVWRSIDPNYPVLSHPIACVDTHLMESQTQVLDDLRTLQIHYVDRVGENYLSVPNKKHRWVYFANMTMGEVILIKQWDSEGTLARHLATGNVYESRRTANYRSTFCLHSAFAAPNEGLPPRRSIEVRCVCIWD